MASCSTRLGFKTLDGQTTGSQGTQAVNGDPDMPNGVTVNHGGMFVVAADQVNYTCELYLHEQHPQRQFRIRSQRDAQLLPQPDHPERRHAGRIGR